MNLFNKVDGYKTYIVAGFVAAATFAKLVGWLDTELYEAFVGILVSLGLVGMRDAVRKLENNK